MDKENKNQKILSIQGLRLFAFMTIFIHHLGWSYCAGTWAVSFFFVLSGAVLMISYYQKDKLKLKPYTPLTFGLKSILKLWPLHLFILTIYFFPNIRLVGGGYKVFLINTFLLQSWCSHSNYYFSFNSVSWFLSTMLFLYICFPLILKLLEKIKSKIALLVVLIVLCGSQVALNYLASFAVVDPIVSDHIIKYLIYIFPPMRLIEFIIGCIVGIFITQLNKATLSSKQTLMIDIGAFLSFILVLLVIIFFTIIRDKIGESRWWVFACLYPVPSSLLIFFCSTSRGYVSKILSFKPIVFFGNLTGYAYLFHLLIIGRATQFVNTNITNEGARIYLIFIIALTITFILSYIWYLAVIGYKEIAKKSPIRLTPNGFARNQ